MRKPALDFVREIRIFDSTGKVERVIAFDDANRRL
jgi:hypothetical protein